MVDLFPISFMENINPKATLKKDKNFEIIVVIIYY